MAAETSPEQGNSLPLCVDVDGTLLRSDLLFESLVALIKQSPFSVFAIPIWLSRGKAVLKSEIAQRVTLDINSLPLNDEVVQYINGAAAAGRQVFLASASHSKFVKPLADRLGNISDSLASDAGVNLKGDEKALRLTERFGEKGFEYIGNEQADFAVWKKSGRVSVVSSNDAFTRSVKSCFKVEKVFSTSEISLKAIAKAMRLHQWMKNILIFFPVVLAHKVFDLHAMTFAVIAFFSFSLVASGVYVLNDLLDLESDRRHPRKKKRPWAAGELSIRYSPMVGALFFAGLGLGACVSSSFLLVLGIYFVTTCLYSFRLKQVPLVDILVLALLYTTRIIAGGEASAIVVSQWLLGVSMFLFLSLACVKRFSELLNLRARNQTISHGRGYHIDDMEQIAMFGSSSGYMAALVLALYVSSEDVEMLYREPKMIWLACPLLLYWISRVWLLARRGLVHEDPLVFALRDRVTYIVAALTVGVFLLAM